MRKITPAGVIDTVAGGGSRTGDGGPATSASVSPLGMAVDAAGNLFICAGNIRKVTPDGTISTVAGNGRTAFSGDGGDPTAASLNGPLGVAVDGTGRLFIADTGNNRVRMVRFDAIPQRPVVSSVVNGASYQGRGIAANTWITIVGKTLSRTTRAWTSADFINGQLPTSLDGVSVNINAKPAYVAYISPTQINALVGSDDTLGMAKIVVVNDQGQSDPLTMAFWAFAPGLFTYAVQGRQYVIAQTPGGEFIGPPNLIPGLTTRPAHPGEVVTVYGTGFGPTDPPVPPGGQVTSPARLTGSLNFRVSLQPADVGYAGLIGPGLYQSNITLPLLNAVYLEDVDQSVTVKVSSASGVGDTQSDLWIPMR